MGEFNCQIPFFLISSIRGYSFNVKLILAALSLNHIKKWIPELQNISIKDIHTWYDSYSENKPNTNYPKPIVIYEIQREKAIEMYKKIFI